MQVGQRGVLELEMEDDVDASALDVDPQVPDGVTLPTRNRATSAKEVAWTVEATKPGRYEIGFPVNGTTVTKEIVVGEELERVSPKRHLGGWIDSFLYACEQPLPADSGVRAITLTLPSVDSWLYGSTWWIVWFLVLSIAVALILKPVFKVKL
jgi:hypothetical protein